MGTFAEEYRNTIMWELNSAANQLDGTAIDSERLAFLVDEHEWDELLNDMRYIGYHSEDSLRTLPVTRMKYRGIEVRKR